MTPWTWYAVGFLCMGLIMALGNFKRSWTMKFFMALIWPVPLAFLIWGIIQGQLSRGETEK